MSQIKILQHLNHSVFNRLWFWSSTKMISLFIKCFLCNVQGQNADWKIARKKKKGKKNGYLLPFSEGMSIWKLLLGLLSWHWWHIFVENKTVNILHREAVSRNAMGDISFCLDGKKDKGTSFKATIFLRKIPLFFPCCVAAEKSANFQPRKNCKKIGIAH